MSFGQHQDTELWNNQFPETKILGPPASWRMRGLVHMASRHKVHVDTFHKGIQYALEKLGKSKFGFESTTVSNFKSKSREGSGNEIANNETVSRQMPCAGNIAKTMTSNGKQFTVTREMLTAVAGISARYSKFAFVFLCYITNHLMAGPLAGPLIPSNLNVSLDFVSGNIEILGKQNSLFPSGPVIKC